MLVLLLSVFHANCYRFSPPAKPNGVPTEAVWAGGPDGGSFVFCDVDLKRDVNRCNVWNDFTGQLVESGEYRLLNEGRAATKSELVYAWADGAGWIGLERDLVLDNLDGRYPH